MGEPNLNRQGLIKLMLRMPALRGQLQLLAARDDHFLSLCGALEEASVTLASLKARTPPDEWSKVPEYEQICAEIEDEIISICYQKLASGQS